MNKNVVRITEEDLRRIVNEAVNDILQNEQTLNEDWKNWAAAGALGAATLFGNPQKADAQNRVVDSFKTPTEMSQQKHVDNMTLNPNKSIVENYRYIQQKITQNSGYGNFSINVDGFYKSKVNNYTCNWSLGTINVSINKNENKKLNAEIIKVLTELYAHSLDEQFDVDSDDYNTVDLNEKRVKLPSGRVYKHSDGSSSDEYVPKTYYLNTLYCLFPTSALYKQIYNKVIEETGLKKVKNMPSGKEARFLDPLYY